MGGAAPLALAAAAWQRQRLQWQRPTPGRFCFASSLHCTLQFIQRNHEHFSCPKNGRAVNVSGRSQACWSPSKLRVASQALAPSPAQARAHGWSRPLASPSPVPQNRARPAGAARLRGWLAVTRRARAAPRTAAARPGQG